MLTRWSFNRCAMKSPAIYHWEFHPFFQLIKNKTKQNKKTNKTHNLTSLPLHEQRETWSDSQRFRQGCILSPPLFSTIMPGSLCRVCPDQLEWRSFNWRMAAKQSAVRTSMASSLSLWPVTTTLEEQHSMFIGEGQLADILMLNDKEVG